MMRSVPEFSRYNKKEEERLKQERKKKDKKKMNKDNTMLIQKENTDTNGFNKCRVSEAQQSGASFCDSLYQE